MLSVEGSGTVQSDNALVHCGGACVLDLPAGTSFSLNATPEADWQFVGFVGSCLGRACALTLDSDASVVARFTPVPYVAITVALAGSGAGHVTSTPAGISCPGACTASFPVGTHLALRATPDGLSRPASWSGACAGASCEWTVSAAAGATARIDNLRYRVTRLGLGASPSAMSRYGRFIAGYGFWTGTDEVEFFWDGTYHPLTIAWPTDIHAVNDAGVMVGITNWRAMRWFNGVTTDLGTTGGTMARAQAINNSGVIAGWSLNPRGLLHAAMWAGGAPVDLGAIEDVYCGYSMANAINEQGVMVGESCATDEHVHPVRFRGPGLIDDLGSPGMDGTARGINDHGVIVGNIVVPNAGNALQRAAVWDGKMIDAGLLPGLENSVLYGINSNGVAAGQAMKTGGPDSAGIAWTQGRLVNLNDLSDSPPGCQVSGANAVDESGRIAASMFCSDGQHAVLLTPY
jgi:uncharacterized membrane protein